MHILITGANGFIGKELAKKMIEEGHVVYAVVDSAAKMRDFKHKHLKVFELLFEDYNQISLLISHDIDIAYHLAWDGLSGQRAENLEIQLNNVVATKVLITELIKLNIKKIIFASSMNTLEIVDHLQKPLRHKTRPMYIHIGSKLNAEIVSRVLCDKYGIEFNSAIIAMVYGENNYSKMITNVFIDSLLKGKSPYLVSGNNLYDIIYVKDVSNALYCIGFHGVDRKRYYIGHNWDRTFKDIFSEIGQIINPNIKLLFGTYNDDNNLSFNSIDRNELTKDTGWLPLFDFRESIIRTANWISNNYGKQN